MCIMDSKEKDIYNKQSSRIRLTLKQKIKLIIKISFIYRIR